MPGGQWYRVGEEAPAGRAEGEAVHASKWLLVA